MIIIAIIAYNVSFQVEYCSTIFILPVYRQIFYSQYIGNLQTFDIGKIFDIEV